MSLRSKVQGARSLAAVIKQWPDDSHKIYKSFRSAQIELYESDKVSDLPSTETLQRRSEAAMQLLKNEHFTEFQPDKRIYSPDGNPMYYELIQREASGKASKVGPVRALKDTLFGWWKK